MQNYYDVLTFYIHGHIHMHYGCSFCYENMTLNMECQSLFTDEYVCLIRYECTMLYSKCCDLLFEGAVRSSR
jgi:hypothetical protein